MKKVKRAFTLTEVLIAMTSVSMIIMLCYAMLSTTSKTIVSEYNNVDNRDALYSNINYITREIQSAEAIKVMNNGKELHIRQVGTDSDDYTIRYEIRDGNPFGALYISNTDGSNSSKLMDLVYETSKFDANSGREEIGFSSYESNSNDKTEDDKSYIGNFKRVTVLEKSGTSSIRVHFSELDLNTADFVLIYDKKSLDKDGGYEALMSATYGDLMGTRFDEHLVGAYSRLSDLTSGYTDWFETDALYVVVIAGSENSSGSYLLDYFEYDNTTNNFGSNTVNINFDIVKDPNEKINTVIQNHKLTVSSRNSHFQFE